MIYCVEDDASIRELVVYTLQATGYEAQGFADGKAFSAAMEQQKPEPVSYTHLTLPTTERV